MVAAEAVTEHSNQITITLETSQVKKRVLKKQTGSQSQSEPKAKHCA